MKYEVDVNGRACQIALRRSSAGFVATLGERELAVDAVRLDAHTWSLLIDGVSHEVSVVPDGSSGQVMVHVGATPVPVRLNGCRRPGSRGDGAAAAAGPQRIVAPMPGKVLRVLVGRGDRVTVRQPVVVIEAMKMENELRAGRDGVVVETAVQPGQSVEAGTLLAVIGAE